MTSRRKREDITAAIAGEEAELARLMEQQARARGRLDSLRRELAALETPLPAVEPKPLPTTTRAEKVKLFARLFRGRRDVFPTRFVAKKSGKAGYAPACANKFVRSVCELPRVKCGECPNQAFLPADEQAIVDHLQGRHTMGVYPLLDDDTCWLLAVDFDKSSWMEDVAAYVDTCRRSGLSPSVERSRSGNGAHVWFFFGSPVSAEAARKMGCHFITETMVRRHELGMESYDRLFPSQDRLPKGGFGNLIALPLQREPRQQGNSVFVDDNFVAFPGDDQWGHLAGVERIDPARVEMIARTATRRGTVIGLGSPHAAAETDNMEQELPAGALEPEPHWGPLPKSIHVILADRMLVEKEAIPSPLLNRIKRLAAFQNPEFFSRQNMRLSTHTTPRVISCAEELKDHIALPRGCTVELEGLLARHGVAVELEDRRVVGQTLEHTFQGELSPAQQEAAHALLAHDTGVFVAPPGVGKTVLGTYLVAKRACSTLVLVHRGPLLDQWMAQLSFFLGIDVKDIGQIGGGKRKPNSKLDVAMLQSLVRHGQVDESVAQYGHVIVDECHHVPAVSVERVLSKVRARYLLGLTATPYRRDGHHPITQMQMGPVRFSIAPKSAAARRPFEHTLVVRETDFQAAGEPAIQQLYGALATDAGRNRLIVADVIAALEEGRSPIVLTERREHLDFFEAELRALARHLVVLHGGQSIKQRRELTARLRSISDDEERLVLATGRYIGEGFDDARLDTLFLALPVSWRGTLQQYAGRLHRLHAAKSEVRIFDYVDSRVPVLLRMFEKRLRGYRSMGYAHGEAPLGYGEPVDDSYVVYDEGDGEP